jgi:membrane associated rhomboid family serine protease
MFPIGDDNSGRRTTPYITYILIVINFIVFFIELSGGDQFIYNWSFIPQRFLANPFTDWITIFTSMFMHAGWLHILGNMLYFWIFGDNVEDRFGHFRFLIFYLICGVAATLAQMAFDPSSNVPSLGASGAIAGIMGSYIFMFPLGWVRVLILLFVVRIPALIVIGIWIVLQIFSGIGSISDMSAGGVAYLAHVGGFFMGLILTPVFKALGPRRYRA